MASAYRQLLANANLCSLSNKPPPVVAAVGASSRLSDMAGVNETTDAWLLIPEQQTRRTRCPVWRPPMPGRVPSTMDTASAPLLVLPTTLPTESETRSPLKFDALTLSP